MKRILIQCRVSYHWSDSDINMSDCVVDCVSLCLNMYIYHVVFKTVKHSVTLFLIVLYKQS